MTATESLQRVDPVPAHSPVRSDDRTLIALQERVDRLERLVEELTAPKPVTVTSDPVDRLRIACVDLGIAMSGDGYVRESDAARLLNRSQSTLRGWRRYFDKPLPYRQVGNRTEYGLADIAGFLDRS